MAKKLYYMEIEGETIYIQVKRVKGLRLRVVPEGVFLSVPPGTKTQEITQFVTENLDWIRRSKVAVEEMHVEEPPITQEMFDEYYDVFLSRLLYWKQRMGVSPYMVKFAYMKSIWGSCNVEKRIIKFNSRLCLYPLECTDYIIVHELAHLVHRGHTPEFWNYVESYIPQWRELRARLRNHEFIGR